MNDFNQSLFPSSQGLGLFGNSGSPIATATPQYDMSNALGGFNNPLVQNGNGGIGGLFGKMGDIFGSKGFNQGVSSFATLANIFTGFKALGLAKDDLKFRKSAFNKNFAASVKDYSNQQKDRFTAKNAARKARGMELRDMDTWLADREIAA